MESSEEASEQFILQCSVQDAEVKGQDESQHERTLLYTQLSERGNCTLSPSSRGSPPWRLCPCLRPELNATVPPASLVFAPLSLNSKHPARPTAGEKGNTATDLHKNRIKKHSSHLPSHRAHPSTLLALPRCPQAKPRPANGRAIGKAMPRIGYHRASLVRDMACRIGQAAALFALYPG